jgi:hypothetical protein
MIKGKIAAISLGLSVIITTAGCELASTLTASEQLACKEYNSAVSRAVSNLNRGASPADALYQLISDGDSISKKSSTVMSDLILKIKQDSLAAISAGEWGDLLTLKKNLSDWKRDEKALADHCNQKAIVIG